MQFDGMEQRRFVTLLGGAAAAWPLAARAQQPAMPVIGFLHPHRRIRCSTIARLSPGPQGDGFVEGETVAVENRWADDQIDRLPMLAADWSAGACRHRHRRKLRVRRQGGNHDDPRRLRLRRRPVRLGLVASLARPGGNLTGINFSPSNRRQSGWSCCASSCPPQRVWPCWSIGLCHDDRGDAAGRGGGGARQRAADQGPHRRHQPRDRHRLRDHRARAARRPLRRPRPFFNSRRVQFAQLAARYAVPTTHPTRPEAEAGGLMSYGPSIADAIVRSASTLAAPQGRQARRPAGRAVEQVRAGH